MPAVPPPLPPAAGGGCSPEGGGIRQYPLHAHRGARASARSQAGSGQLHASSRGGKERHGRAGWVVSVDLRAF